MNLKNIFRKHKYKNNCSKFDCERKQLRKINLCIWKDLI